jgi:hypothetical protein
MAPPQKDALLARRAALGRFDTWAAANPMDIQPADAVAAAGRLYELLPALSRHRPVDPRGIMTFHRLLRLAFERLRGG